MRNLNLIFRGVIFLSFVSFPIDSSFAGGKKPPKGFKTECTIYHSPADHSVCITDDQKTENPNIVYYFHGLNGSSRDWTVNKTLISILERWNDRMVDAPKIISVSFGGTWLLTNQNSAPFSGLLPVFHDEIIPEIESNIPGFIGNRKAIGFSMGGANVTQLTLNYPELFQQVAAVCPAIFNLSPYATVQEIDDFILRTGADRERVGFYLLTSRRFYPDHQTWFNEFQLTQLNRQPQNLPKHYISAGRADPWGIFLTTQEFARVLIGLRPDSVWRPTSGGHCDNLDTNSIADFLL